MAEKGIVALRNTLENQEVRKQFENALKDNAQLFMASIMDVVSSDRNLQECKPGDVVKEALKAAVLKLPLNKQLGFAYIVPFKEKGAAKPQFIVGYKGLIQLAIRTGQYRHINAGEVYEGEIVKRDRITGDAQISGEPKSNKVIGYFAYIELTNGFRKLIYKTKEEVIEHAKKYSKSYNSQYSAWKTDFDKMAKKTVLRELINTYGIKSVEFLSMDGDIKEDAENNTDNDVIEVESEPIIESPQSHQPETSQKEAGPGF